MRILFPLLVSIVVISCVVGTSTGTLASASNGIPAAFQESFDWTNHNNLMERIAMGFSSAGTEKCADVIGRIGNIGHCGSDWAMTTAEMLRDRLCIITSGQSQQNLSTQQMVDCSAKDYGCLGGDMKSAMTWIEANGGICTNNAYPYRGEAGPCKRSCSKAATLTGYRILPSRNEDAMKQEIWTNGPLVALVDSGSAAYSLYKGGIISSPNCGTNLDHAVRIVGWGTTSGVAFWKVANAWGTDFNDGFVKLELGKNQCGIAQAVVAASGVSGND